MCKTSHMMMQNVRRSLVLLCIAVESTRLPCSALGFVVTSPAPPPSKSKARCVALFCQQICERRKCQAGRLHILYPLSGTERIFSMLDVAPQPRRRWTDAWLGSRFDSVFSLLRPVRSISAVSYEYCCRRPPLHCYLCITLSVSRPSLLATFNLIC